MYKILNSQGLGVGSRQNELIELALTYKFDGVEVDMVDLLGRHDTLGKEFACQFFKSASTDMGTFHLPVKLGGTDEEYQASVAKLDTIVDLATTLGSKQCYIKIEPTSKNFTFQENFEKHQSRLQEIGAKFEPHGIRIGLALQSAGVNVGEGEYKFIHTAEEILTLAKTVGQSNVGLCLDTWQWVVGGGALDQLQEVDAANLVTELRLADVTPGTDLEKATRKDRTALPGDSADAFSFKVTQYLKSAGYDGPISVATAPTTFDDDARTKVVEDLSKRLDLIIAGEDPAQIAAAAAAEAAQEAEAAGEGGAEGGTEGDAGSQEEAVAAGSEAT